MGMSTHVVGIVPPDETFTKMLAIYEACVAADIEVPDEVSDFFDGSPPDPKGVIVDLEKTGAVTEWDDDDMSQGHEIDLSKVPSHIKLIRVYNSW